MSREHNFEPEWFLELGSNLADEFVRSDAFADRELERLANGIADGLCDADGWFARAGEVKITLVNRTNLDVRRKIIGIGKHQPGKEFVFLEITGQQDQLGTKPTRHDAGHRCVNAELAGFIRGGSNNAALLATYRDRFASQAGVRRLLDRGEEG